MKREIAQFVAQCLMCQQVKAKHQRPAGLLQPLDIPVWKWEHITMDFVTGLPKTPSKNDAAWVIVDRLMKSAHFLPIRVGFTLEKLAKLYMKEIVRLHYKKFNFLRWNFFIAKNHIFVAKSICNEIYHR